jgi:hypothetical protein
MRTAQLAEWFAAGSQTTSLYIDLERFSATTSKEQSRTCLLLYELRISCLYFHIFLLTAIDNVSLQEYPSGKLPLS